MEKNKFPKVPQSSSHTSRVTNDPLRVGWGLNQTQLYPRYTKFVTPIEKSHTRQFDHAKQSCFINFMGQNSNKFLKNDYTPIIQSQLY